MEVMLHIENQHICRNVSKISQMSTDLDSGQARSQFKLRYGAQFVQQELSKLGLLFVCFAERHELRSHFLQEPHAYIERYVTLNRNRTIDGSFGK